MVLNAKQRAIKDCFTKSSHVTSRVVELNSVYPFHWINPASISVLVHGLELEILTYGIFKLPWCWAVGWCMYLSSKGKVSSCSWWLGLHWNSWKTKCHWSLIIASIHVKLTVHCFYRTPPPPPPLLKTKEL